MGRFINLFCIAFVLYPGSTYSAWDLNMPIGVTDTSQAIYGLHMTIFYVCLAIAVVVFGVMFWSIFHHRKSKGHEAVQFHEHVTVEIIWSIVPFFILIAMAVPATAVLVDMYDSTESDIDILVTGYQWKWHYKYIGEDVDFFSVLATSKEEIENKKKKNPNYLLEVDNPLVVPIDKKIRFLFTSNDVIHAWWVPDLAVKKDAVPGFINESWTRINEPGTYRGQCAELCGKHHGFMPIEVKAVTEPEYQTWLQEQKASKLAVAASSQKEWTMDDLMVQGAMVYEKNCAVCHQAGGEGMPPIFPALNGSAIATGEMAEHLKIVMDGKTGTAMPAFAKQLSAVDLAAVITYERNAWDNKTGDKVTPAEVQALMGEGL
ncbi:MAG: cytochrome c oxidase subunit II [Piscirickettsiaceae bacterium]|nr:cytochrome c oxidase subunit II [Piscirickettsiaceae bacterium]